MNGVRKQSAGIGARALARRELQYEQRGVDQRIVRHRHRRREHNWNRQRAAQRLSCGRHEDILEHAPHFFATRGKVAEDHADVARRPPATSSRAHCAARSSSAVASSAATDSYVYRRLPEDAAISTTRSFARHRSSNRAIAGGIASKPAQAMRSDGINPDIVGPVEPAALRRPHRWRRSDARTRGTMRTAPGLRAYRRSADARWESDSRAAVASCVLRVVRHSPG